jgi:uncharacterized iron-regulated protein
MLRLTRNLTLLALAALSVGCSHLRTPTPPLSATQLNPVWVNLMNGEPQSFSTVMDDLATAQVIYLGERHTIDRHHEIQTQVIRELHKRGIALAVGIEQMEFFNQPALDQYARGEIDFEGLAAATDWGKRWKNYPDYKGILEAAREAGAKLVALNGRNETIRAVNRSGGVANITPEQRAELPAEMQMDDPGYERLLQIQMMAHMSVDAASKLRPIVEAQIARDESMAEHGAQAIQPEADGTTRTLVVICGSGHVNYGLGTASRLQHRLPDSRQRIVVMSVSGEMEPVRDPNAREIDVTLDQLKALGRPLADYLMIVPGGEEPENQEK